MFLQCYAGSAQGGSSTTQGCGTTGGTRRWTTGAPGSIQQQQQQQRRGQGAQILARAGAGAGLGGDSGRVSWQTLIAVSGWLQVASWCGSEFC